MGSFALLAPVGCAGAKARPVTVFAAASTREALEQAVADFRDQTGVAVEVNLGPSNTLARQIEQGAAADLFLPADVPWADYLQERGLVEDRRDLLTNRLVLVVPADSRLAIDRLADLAEPAVRRLALAGEGVPAGNYGRQALQTAGVWEQVRQKVVDAGDVRAALRFVTRGEAEAGMVYATDVDGRTSVRVAVRVEPSLHGPIRYPLVLVKRRPVSAEARRLYDYLLSPPAADVFRRAGFGVVP